MCSFPDRFAFSPDRLLRTPLAAIALLFPFHLAAQQFKAVDAAIRDGILAGVYPGAVVVVGSADSILMARGYGHFTWSPSSAEPDPRTTRWDLASLTKVVATTSAAAALVQRGKLDLDVPVSRYLPAFSGGRKGEVTVRMLLTHTSGMPAYAPLWKTAHSPAEARNQLFAIPLARAPGSSAVYSDLNGMLAGLVVARVGDAPLEEVARSTVFAPLGMAATGYRPDPAQQVHAAPTGRYHGHPVGGVVNDQNAVVLGGVSGHAGLFSTGLDLARFAQGWLNASRGRGAWLTRQTVADFLAHAPASGTRVVGWDTPIPSGGKKESLYGRCTTVATFGHTGWTGTEIWIDTREDLFVVLLTNRSFAPRAPAESFRQLKEVRSRVADAVRSAVGECR
jgi:CubicO group peptidase (beta-lactamase class C family)